MKVRVDDQKKIGKEHMERSMNIENEWSDSIDASKVEGAVTKIEVQEVSAEASQMKIEEPDRPSESCFRNV